MIYANANAVFRGDVTSAVMEASDWEKGLIADLVFPVVNSPVRSGQYPKFNKVQGQLLKRDAKARAAGAAYARGDFAYIPDNFLAIEYGIEYPVDDTVAADISRFFDAEVVAGKLGKRKVLLEKELRVSNSVMNAANFDVLTPTVSYTTTNRTTMDAVADIDASKDLLTTRGEIATTAIIPYQVWTRIKASTIFQARARGFGYGDNAVLQMTPEVASEVFGLNIIIPRVAYDAAIEGAAFSSTNVWPNSFIWVGKVVPTASTVGMLDGGAGYQINWSEYGPNLAMFTYRDEPHKSNIVRSSQYQAEKIVNSAAGTLIATQYA